MTQRDIVGEIHPDIVAADPEIDSSHPEHYLQYWPEIEKSERSLKKNELFRQGAQRTHTKVHRLTERISVLSSTEGVSALTEVEHWYERLGSTNEMFGAEEALGDALDVMVEEAERGELFGKQYILGGDIAFDLLLLHGKNNMLAAESVDYLADTAQRFYASVVEQEERPYGGLAQRATRLMFDVEFERLRQQHPWNEDEGNIADHQRKFARKRYGQLLRTSLETAVGAIDGHLEEVSTLTEQMQHHQRRGNEEKARKIKRHLWGDIPRVSGDVFEWFAPSIYRFIQHRERQERSALIRTALTREEDPRFDVRKKDRHLVPNQSVDVIIQRYMSDYYIESEAYQLKLGEYTKDRPYMPQILLFDGFRDVASGILDRVKSRREQSDNRDLDFTMGLKQVFEFMIQDLSEDPFKEKEQERAILEDLLDSVQERLQVA